MTVEIRDRIRELRRVKASTLIPHPQNPRRHPHYQRSAMRGVLEEIIADGVAQGEFRDVDVAVAATTLMAALEGLALQAMVDPEFDIEQRLDGLWDFLMGGMSA